MAEIIPWWAVMNFAKRRILYLVVFQTRPAGFSLSMSRDLREDLKAFASKMAFDTANNSEGDGVIFERKRCGNGVAGKANVNHVRVDNQMCF